MKYRSRYEIFAAILRTAEKGAHKTRLTQGGFTSQYQANEYIPFLVGKHLLTYDEESRLYTTTESGRQFLKNYDGIEKMLQ